MYNLISIFNLIVLVYYIGGLFIEEEYNLDNLINEIPGFILLLLTIIVSKQFFLIFH
jgi:hypothetical protein